MAIVDSGVDNTHPFLGGRVVEVVFYEWPFYSAHPQWIAALWLGGMATHGLLFGVAIGHDTREVRNGSQ